jgi:hypothetical protein
MEKIIKKILKEELGDWDWVDEDKTDLPPIKEIHEWCENNRIQLANWIQKIDQFYEKTDKMTWDGDENDLDRMIGLSVKGIGNELRNIYSSFESIGDEIDYIENPEKFDD